MHTPPWYGKLTVVCGPMYASKTTSLLQKAFWHKEKLGQTVVVLKPAVDTRYTHGHVESHDGIKIEATPISSWPEIADNVAHVFIDEAQFFTPENFTGNLPDEIHKLLQRGIDVLACGLDMDWRGRPFDVTAQLLAMADEVKKVRAVCHECGAPAMKNFKLVPNERQVEIGSSDKYQARCNQHWHSHNL